MSTDQARGLGIMAVVVLAMAMANAACAGILITPVSAAANTQYDAGHAAGALIDPMDMNPSNQHVAEPFPNGGSWLGTDEWGTWENWVYLDLGAAYDVEAVRIWNYQEDGGPFEVIGRGAKDATLWVAGPGATLPTSGVPTGMGNSGFTAAMGWTQVWGGALAVGPSTVAPVPDMDPTDVFDLIAYKGVQYVGIDIDTRWGGDAWRGFDPLYPTPFTNYAPGLAQVQVTRTPEPTSLTLLGMAAVALWRRRRRT